MTAGSVTNGAGSPGQQCWIGRRSRFGSSDDLLAGAARHGLRHRVGQLLQLAEPLDLVDEALRRLQLEDVGDAPPELVERVDAERERHPPLGPELVHEERVLRALRVLEEERRAAGLDRAVDDLRDLEVRVDLGVDLDELALLAAAGRARSGGRTAAPESSLSGCLRAAGAVSTRAGRPCGRAGGARGSARADRAGSRRGRRGRRSASRR